MSRKETLQRYYQKNKEKLKQNSKLNYEKRKLEDPEFKEKRQKYRLKWEKQNPGYHTEYLKKKYKLIIDVLGGKCSVCGNSDIRVLQLHHVKQHEKLHKLDWMWKAFLSAEIELLCANCHCIRHSRRV